MYKTKSLQETQTADTVHVNTTNVQHTESKQNKAYLYIICIHKSFGMSLYFHNEHSLPHISNYSTVLPQRQSILSNTCDGTLTQLTILLCP